MGAFFSAFRPSDLSAAEVREQYEMLCHSASKGDFAAVKRLWESLSPRMDLPAHEYYGVRRLSVVRSAVQGGNPEVVRLVISGLTREQLDFQEAQYRPNTLFQSACNWGHLEAAKIIFDAGADPVVRNYDGRTILHLAAGSGHEAVVRWILSLPFASRLLEAQDRNGQTPLIRACIEDQLAVAKTLREHGADLEARDKFGRTILSLAAEFGHAQIVQWALDLPIDLVSRRDKVGDTALELAIRGDNTDCAELLLAAGADFSPKTPAHHPAVIAHCQRLVAELEFVIIRDLAALVVAYLEPAPPQPIDVFYGYHDA